MAKLPPLVSLNSTFRILSPQRAVIHLICAQRIILQVLVANRVIPHGPDHRRKVTHLEMPDSVLFQNGSDVLHEAERILQVIEHCDRCDDARPPCSEFFAEQLSGEKIGDQANVFPIVRREFPGGGIDPHDGKFSSG